MKKALISGVSGQDGALLAKLLLGKGYMIVGTSREVSNENLWRLDKLGVSDAISFKQGSFEDRNFAEELFGDMSFDEIYLLAGQSSVGRSYSEPGTTISGLVMNTLNVVETLRQAESSARVFCASSSECFGDLGTRMADETTEYRPFSPYGVAKASTNLIIRQYRETYGLFAVNGMLFNHESPLRSNEFVIKKIAGAAARIAAGSGEVLCLGRLDVVRDWGWAPEYVVAFWRMLQHEAPEDFILATGRACSLRDMVDATFAEFGLDWRDHVAIDPALTRPRDPGAIRANSDKAERLLSWRAELAGVDVARRLAVEVKLDYDRENR